jgi:hypothetical protein
MNHAADAVTSLNPDPGRLDGGADDPGARSTEDLIERGGEGPVS